MDNKEWEVGDIVREIFSGEECRVVATKEKPYKEGTFFEARPHEGTDYVLIPVNANPDGGFTPFIYAPKEHVQDPELF